MQYSLVVDWMPNGYGGSNGSNGSNGNGGSNGYKDWAWSKMCGKHGQI